MVPTEVKRPARSGVIKEIGELVVRVKIGERIYFSEYSGQYVHITNDLSDPDYIVMLEDEILAIEIEQS